MAFAERQPVKKTVSRSLKRAANGKQPAKNTISRFRKRAANGEPRVNMDKPPVNIELSIVADLSNLKILQGRFVFDVCTGTFHRVSETAAFILGEMKRKVSIDELVRHYSERYGISRAIAERDIELFLNDLSVARLPVFGSVGTQMHHQRS